MIRLYITIFIFTVLTFNTVNTSAQTNDNYYWFCISVEQKISEETKIKIIKITEVSDTIKSGSFDNFIETHFDNLQKGVITIGPFSGIEDAKLSKKIYKELENYKSEKEYEQNFYLFFVKPVKIDSSKSIKFKNIPARVTVCTPNLFADIMREGCNFNQLAIGPFTKYELAEKSKYTFLKNGKLYSPTEYDSIAKLKLQEMVKKWKNLRITVVKQKNKDVVGKTFYRLIAIFPKKYFESDAVQIILISPVYKNSSEQIVHGISLQGRNILDNNRVIDFDEKTNYSEILYFNNPDNAKVTGFTAEGFIYDQSTLIKLPKRQIKFRH